MSNDQHFLWICQRSLVLGLIVTLDWKVAAMIADGHKGGEASPVVYVSGEEVCF